MQQNIHKAMKEQSIENLQKNGVSPYKSCLNCGADLQGMYCHKCGQQASSPTPKVSEFILEYLNNAYIWDPKFFLTIWNLVRRPGFLTNEFNAGRFVAYEHPLKLNMFFLFVFVTIFLLFSDIHKADDTFDTITRSELVRPHLSLNALSTDKVYSSKMQSSERDTIQLSVMLASANEFPEIIGIVRPLTDNGEEQLDTLLATVPEILIKDGILVRNTTEVYSFSEKNAIVDKLLNMDLVSSIMRKLIDILTQYFPMLFLLTSPLLAFAVKLLHVRRKAPSLSYFIFALHYTAFIEFMLLAIYLLYLTVDPGIDVLQWIMILSSCLYLTVAVKQVYEPRSWIKSILKAFMISLTYFMICFCIFIAIFITTIFAVVI